MICGTVAPVVLVSEIGSASSGEVPGATSGVDAEPFAATTPTDNDSTQHEDPDEAGEDGDLGSVKGWLLGRMGGRLEGSLINLSQGQYDAAEGLLGEETEDFLGQYVDVAGETENEDDDETAETVNETIEEQEEFVEQRRNFSEVYSEYLEALENDNIERARRLLQELGLIANRLDRTARNLTQYYRTLDDETESVTEAPEIIGETEKNVSEILNDSREDLFDDTRIVIENSTTTASVVDPIVVRGRVQVETGEADAGNDSLVPSGDVVIDRIGARASVNETGHFAFRYRPPPLFDSGNLDLLLEYVPLSNSTYLASTATVETTIESRQPTLQVSAPTNVSFGDDLGLTANLTVDGRPIDGVPIRASLGETGIASTTTADGVTELSGVIPAAVDDGTRELQVRLPIEGRAVEAVTVTRELQVQRTATRLQANATTISPTELRVQGRLETAGGAPVPGQSVQLAIGGSDVRTIRSNATGEFDETLAIPDRVNTSVFPNRVAPITTSFTAPSTNLGPSNASGTIIVPTRPLIVIEGSTTNSSVLDPIVVRGQVLVESTTPQLGDLTPVTTGSVLLDGVGARVPVNETGHFALRHRPILLPRGETTLSVAYQAPASSTYFDSTAEFATTIEGRKPTLEINGTPDAVRFGDRIDIETRLTVENRSIAGVPINATLGGVPLASAMSANGTTTLSGVVPATVDDGQRELRVVLPFSGRALVSANATRTVRVRQTDTRLRTNVTALSATRVLVQGRLETINGTPVPGQSVRIDIAGVDAGSVRTDGTGDINQSIRIPEGVSVSNVTDRRVPVNVTFSAGETNLAPSNATETVTIPEAQAPNGSDGTPPSGVEGTPPDDSDESGLFGLGVPWWGWLGALVLVVFAVAGVYLGRTRFIDQDGTVGEEGPAASAAESESDPGSEESPRDGPPSLIEMGFERLEAGASDTATQAGYEAVRRRLAERLGVVAGTHWELYRASQAAGWPEDRVAAIRRLTEAYEQAAFAPGSLSAEAARETLTTARRLLDDDDDVASGSD
jgi:hypothetical protein